MRLVFRNLATADTLIFMSTAFDTAAFEKGTDPILRFLTREQAIALVAYAGEPDIRARVMELADRNTEGELTDEERAEYAGYVKANKFVAILQAKARKLISGT